MVITVAGAQNVIGILRIGNGFSNLQVGTDGRCFIQPKGHHFLPLLSPGNQIGLLGKQAIVCEGSVHENQKAKRINVLSSSTISSETSKLQPLENAIEKAIFNCRFLTLMGVVGSLAGSVLCFMKGAVYVYESFKEYFRWCLSHHHSGKVIFLLVEALDVYLMGTVMLIFGMGLYGLFVNTLEVPGENSTGQVSRTVCGSNLFGLFKLQERPKWLEIQSLEELKTKLGHVIVMILLVGMFDKSKKIPINSSLDLVCFSMSILLSSGCLYLLSKLHSAH
eukprot:Gb_05502 [translate_table: standard]